jgi:hypothetical protein
MARVFTCSCRARVRVRGTLIATSREQLKVAGVFASYCEKLTPEAHSVLSQVIAASWVPVALAHAHFAAIDRLGLDVATIEANTSLVASKLNGVFLGTVAQAARAAGVTPWAGIRVVTATWRRVFKGGALAIQRVGPKEANLVSVGNSLLVHRYHRVGFRMHVTGAVQIFSARPFVREVSYEPATQWLSLRLQWA